MSIDPRVRPKIGSGISDSAQMGMVALALTAAACVPVPTVNRYPQTDCVRYLHAKTAFKADVSWCARYVELRSDVMEVRVTWELLQLQGSANAIFQITDEENRRMYLTDEFGHRYEHIRVTDAALGSRYQIGAMQGGSYFFPLPRSGARKFQFHDDENRVRLELHL